MKKMLSLMLALMLLALCPAMAETVEQTQAQTQTMTSPDGSYAIEVPADYLPMNAEVMLTLFSTEEMQQAFAQALGLADASQLTMYFEMLDENNMLIVYNGDMSGNLNVQANPTRLTMDQIVVLKELMDAQVAQQYINLGIAEEDIHPMEIQEIGGRRWYGMQLVMLGNPMQTMMTVVNDYQYTLTFTGIDAQVMQSVLETFTVTAAAE